MFELSDERLISKALKGNEKAWVILVKRYEKPIYNYALRMVSNPDDALDLMQETFISVNRSLENYRGEGSFKSWLFRIANFRCIEFYRRRKPTEDIDEIAKQESDPGFSPEHVLSQTQHSAQMLNLLARLPVEQKIVVELKFYQQFTFEEIAEQLNTSSNTVKSRLYSALAKLKQFLEVEYV